MAEAIVARIGDRVQCDVRHPTPRTITMVLQTPEAVANANWLLADKSSGWRLLASPTAHLSAYEDATSTGNEGVSGWVGCGECDPVFACHNGKARCIRLPASGVQGKCECGLSEVACRDPLRRSCPDGVAASGDETFRAEYTREELGEGVRGKYREIDWGAVDEELRTIVYSQTNCHIPEKAWGDLRALLRKVSGQ